MELNTLERQIVDNWFTKHSDLEKLINKTSKQISNIKYRLRKKFLSNQRSYLSKTLINQMLNLFSEGVESGEVSKKLNIDSATVYRYKNIFNKRKSLDVNDYLYNYQRKPWTLDQQIYIEQNFQKGSKFLMKKIKRSNGSIILKRNQIRKHGGIFYNTIEEIKTKDPARRERVKKAIIDSNGGLTTKQISIILNESVYYVNQIKNLFNLKTLKRNHKTLRYIEIIRESNGNLTSLQLSKILNISRHYVRELARNNNLKIKSAYASD